MYNTTLKCYEHNFCLHIQLMSFHDKSPSVLDGGWIVSITYVKLVMAAEDKKFPLQYRYNEDDGVSNRQPHDCLLLKRLFRRRSRKTSKLRVTGLCVGNAPVTGEFPAQRTSNAENISIWWCHHAVFST